MLFRFVYRTADINALSRILDITDIYISAVSVHKCEWHSMQKRHINLRLQAPWAYLNKVRH